MGYFYITALLGFSAFVLSITSQSQHDVPKNFRRHIGSPPTTDWETGLREAVYQAFVRERYTQPGVQEYVLSAPLLRQPTKPTPFGDIAVLARGQLYSTGDGFQFIQDPNSYDCEDCDPRHICGPVSCQWSKSQERGKLLALWTVRRIRHRDEHYGHRYELQYTVSALNGRENLISRNGAFNYDTAGHVYAVKSNSHLRQPLPNEYAPSSSKQEARGYDYGGERTIPLTYLPPVNPPTNLNNDRHYLPPLRPTTEVQPAYHFKPGFLVGVGRNGYKHVLHSLPLVPPERSSAKPDTHIHHHFYEEETTTGSNLQKELQLYKQLLESLAQKSSRPDHIALDLGGKRTTEFIPSSASSYGRSSTATSGVFRDISPISPPSTANTYSPGLLTVQATVPYLTTTSVIATEGPSAGTRTTAQVTLPYLTTSLASIAMARPGKSTETAVQSTHPYLTTSPKIHTERPSLGTTIEYFSVTPTSTTIRKSISSKSTTPFRASPSYVKYSEPDPLYHSTPSVLQPKMPQPHPTIPVVPHRKTPFVPFASNPTYRKKMSSHVYNHQTTIPTYGTRLFSQSPTQQKPYSSTSQFQIKTKQTATSATTPQSFRPTTKLTTVHTTRFTTESSLAPTNEENFDVFLETKQTQAEKPIPKEPKPEGPRVEPESEEPKPEKPKKFEEETFPGSIGEQLPSPENGTDTTEPYIASSVTQTTSFSHKMSPPPKESTTVMGNEVTEKSEYSFEEIEKSSTLMKIGTDHAVTTAEDERESTDEGEKSEKPVTEDIYETTSFRNENTENHEDTSVVPTTTGMFSEKQTGHEASLMGKTYESGSTRIAVSMYETTQFSTEDIENTSLQHELTTVQTTPTEVEAEYDATFTIKEYGSGGANTPEENVAETTHFGEENIQSTTTQEDAVEEGTTQRVYIDNKATTHTTNEIPTTRTEFQTTDSISELVDEPLRNIHHKTTELPNPLDEIFGEIVTEHKPQSTTDKTVTKSKNTSEIDELFDDVDEASTEEILVPHTTTHARPKIIYSNFYVASTAEPTTRLAFDFTSALEDQVQSTDNYGENQGKLQQPKNESETQNVRGTTIQEEIFTQAAEETTPTEYVTIAPTEPLTSQSYSTSISFEVNRRGHSHSDSSAKAKLTEINLNNTEYAVYKAVYKAEYPQKNGQPTNDDSTNAFDAVALSLVNHARSIDYFDMRNEEQKYARRNYTSKHQNEKKIEE